MSLRLSSPKRISKQRATTLPLLEYANINRNRGHFNDVNIKSGYDIFPANRMALSCYCGFFEKLFKSKTNEALNSTVEVQDVDGISLHHLIEYIYTGNINISSDNVFGLLVGAHYLELDEVRAFCFDFLLDIMTIDNCIVIYQEAVKYENFDLKQKIYKLISEHFDEVVRSDDFKNLSYLDLFPCLYNINRQLVRETVLCRSIIDWTVSDMNSRKEWFQSRLIRFVNISKLPSEILQNIVTKNIIDDDHPCLDLIKERIEEKSRNEKIISIGGWKTRNNVIKIWNLQRQANHGIPDLPFDICRHRAIKRDNCVYCIGGDKSGDYDVTNQVWRINLEEDELIWKEINPMIKNRCRFGATAYNKALIVCGGKDNDNKVLTSTEAYFHQTEQWKLLPSLNNKRHGHELVALDGYLYAIGGRNEEERCLSSVERMHGLNGLWEEFDAPLRIARAVFVAVRYNFTMYVMGGMDKKRQVLESVEMFDTNLQKWTSSKNMNIARWGHSACVFQNKIFVVGGWDKKNEFVKEIECFDISDETWHIIGNNENGLVYHSIVSLL